MRILWYEQYVSYALAVLNTRGCLVRGPPEPRYLKAQVHCTPLRKAAAACDFAWRIRASQETTHSTLSACLYTIHCHRTAPPEENGYTSYYIYTCVCFCGLRKSLINACCRAAADNGTRYRLEKALSSCHLEFVIFDENLRKQQTNICCFGNFDKHQNGT